MSRFLARGLSADWLNAWLAAIGITVLAPDVRLAWTSDPVPRACFDSGETDLAAAIAARLGTAEKLEALAISRDHPMVESEFPRNVTCGQFLARAPIARATADHSLACTVTDLVAERDMLRLPHSPFDPPAPRGETLHDRLMRCRRALADEIEDLCEQIAETLDGGGARVEANGLGFDYRRIASGSHADSVKTVDPVIEVLAFHGIALYPVRGDGARAACRGWLGAPSRRGALWWPVWAPALDRWAVDALLDRFHSLQREEDQRPARSLPMRSRLWGVTGAFSSVPYKAAGANDNTRAYGAERVW